MQLRQHQVEQRKEKQQAKGTSMDDMLGGTKGNKSGSKSAGLSQASMTAMISADTSIKQAKVQGSVATSMEGRAGILKSEIKNNHGSDVTKKKEELADVTQKAQAATASQMNTLAEVNKAMEEAAVADRNDNKTSVTEEEKTGQAENTGDSSKSRSTTEYADELAKLVPSVDFMVGNGCSSAKSGKTLTINPKLLEKMQNDPEQAKKTKELIRGVESAMNLIDSINKAGGWTVVYKHSYIDENGKYHSVGYYRNDFMLNLSDKLREERKKNSEKLLEKTKEKAAEKKEKLEETLEEKKTEKAGDGSAYNKAEQLINEKMADSKDGTIYLNDTDMKTIIEAAQEEDADKTTVKDQPQVGANLDLKI